MPKSWDQLSSEERRDRLMQYMQARRDRREKILAVRRASKPLKLGDKISAKGFEVLKEALRLRLEAADPSGQSFEYRLLDKIGRLDERGPSSDGFYNLKLEPEERLYIRAVMGEYPFLLGKEEESEEG